jgi:hypothetical protein
MKLGNIDKNCTSLESLVEEENNINLTSISVEEPVVGYVKKVFSVEGNAETYEYSDEFNNYKAIRIFDVVDGADVALELTSVDKNDEHKLLTSFLGHDVKLTIETLN